MSGKLGLLHVAVGMLLGSIFTEFTQIGPLLRSMTTGDMDEFRFSGMTATKHVTDGISTNNAETAVLCRDAQQNVSNASGNVLPASNTKSNDESVQEPSVPKLVPVAEKRQGFCGRLAPGASSSYLWKSNRDKIIKATKEMFVRGIDLPVLEDKSYPPWLNDLYTLLHPRFLRLGYRHAPLPSAMKEVLEIVDQALQKKRRPLSIAVVGGSVTYGSKSCNDPFQKHAFDQTAFQCRWPGILQNIFDEFLGPDIVTVENLAVGGTGTPFSTTIVKYKLYPEGVKSLKQHDPDIIINAYSTNDAFPSSANNTYDNDFRRVRRDIAQDFITACHESRPCSGLPMVVYLDDYVGNQHNLVLAENSNGWLTQEMAEWHGAMYISYAAAVRRLVYGNEKETLLTSYWPWHSTRKGDNPMEVHFPLSAHMSVSWVVAYAVLSAVVDFCEDGYDDTDSAKAFPNIFSQAVMDLVERVPPPELNADTMVETVSKNWLNKSQTQEASNKDTCNNLNGAEKEVPCIIAMICGPVGTVRRPQKLRTFLKKVVTGANGWGVETQIADGGWHYKLGYVAHAANATTTFFKDNTHTQVRALKVSYLRSYGEKWKDSRAKFTLRAVKAGTAFLEKTFTLEGSHNSNTSIAYQHELDLGEESIPPNVRVELNIQMIGGTSFKIIGLTMCNRS